MGDDFLPIATVEGLLKEIGENTDGGSILGRLAEELRRPDYLYEVSDSVYVDFTYFNLLFCREAGFGARKAQVVVSLLEKSFAHASKTRFADVHATYAVLKDGVLACCEAAAAAADGDDPAPAEAGAVVNFSPEDVERITQYVTRTFARYFPVYRRVFADRREETETLRRIQVETPLIPPPLSAATDETGGGVARGRPTASEASSGELAQGEASGEEGGGGEEKGDAEADRSEEADE
jgi:hypothetical protein